MLVADANLVLLEAYVDPRDYGPDDRSRISRRQDLLRRDHVALAWYEGGYRPPAEENLLSNGNSYSADGAAQELWPQRLGPMHPHPESLFREHAHRLSVYRFGLPLDLTNKEKC